jgi:hypothetical protein
VEVMEPQENHDTVSCSFSFIVLYFNLRVSVYFNLFYRIFS